MSLKQQYPYFGLNKIFFSKFLATTLVYVQQPLGTCWFHIPSGLIKWAQQAYCALDRPSGTVFYYECVVHHL